LQKSYTKEQQVLLILYKQNERDLKVLLIQTATSDYKGF
jgi:hypothetical protein